MNLKVLWLNSVFEGWTYIASRLQFVPQSATGMGHLCDSSLLPKFPYFFFFLLLFRVMLAAISSNNNEKNKLNLCDFLRLAFNSKNLAELGANRFAWPSLIHREVLMQVHKKKTQHFVLFECLRIGEKD